MSPGAKSWPPCKRGSQNKPRSKSAVDLSGRKYCFTHFLEFKIESDLEILVMSFYMSVFKDLQCTTLNNLYMLIIIRVSNTHMNTQVQT